MIKRIKFLLGLNKQKVQVLDKDYFYNMEHLGYARASKRKVYIGGSQHAVKSSFQGLAVRFRQRLLFKKDYHIGHVFFIAYDKFIGDWLVFESAGLGTHAIGLDRFLKEHEITFLSEQTGQASRLIEHFFAQYSNHAYGYFSGIGNIICETMGIPFRFKKTGAYICSELVLEMNLQFGAELKEELLEKYVGDRDHDLITPIDIVEMEKILTENNLSKIILINETKE